MPPAIPLVPKLAEIKSQMHKQGSNLILMVDHPAQIEALKDQPAEAPWLVYLKLDIGSKWVLRIRYDNVFPKLTSFVVLGELVNHLNQNQ